MEHAVRILAEAPVQRILELERGCRLMIFKVDDIVERKCILIVHDLLRAASCRTKS